MRSTIIVIIIIIIIIIIIVVDGGGFGRNMRSTIIVIITVYAMTQGKAFVSFPTFDVKIFLTIDICATKDKIDELRFPGVWKCPRDLAKLASSSI